MAASYQGTSEKSSRNDSSLYVLTIKLLEMINGNMQKTIDLNYASETLKVHKRRLYDVTNILEGLQLVERVTTNTFRWIGDDPTYIIDEYNFNVSVLNEELSEKENGLINIPIKKKHKNAASENFKASCELIEMERLKEKEKKLDDEINKLYAELNLLSTDPSIKDFLYINYQDLISLESLKSQTSFAVKAPHDAYFEMSNENNEYVLQINSNNDHIDVFYIGEEQ
ncbi:hypothetical protein EDEG_00786 [Edhazardia aedis USNM 41457]|uniref:E2F/DP family winged-helix DNA-binding domain-containing protein n=1 Tax=Edhazardia aedis (strain USNM 41457) TaxID=1003232 RepID=J9DBL6_EDHAE|nr:hypothetical protein EDEG_00786 [Edhazardia aedis USNM 41457]|eukprot:EJW05116.1 hypothetical protein EDEG_00786 [Edhazardia aedis USNM 41457]